MEEEMDVYGQALVKKRGKYWSKGIPSNKIDAYFQQKQVGFSETLEIPFNGHPFFIYHTKEEKKVTKTMSTHGTCKEAKDNETY